MQMDRWEREDVLHFMQMYVHSAALAAALELGVFWILAEQPMSGSQIAEQLSIPRMRCHYWLELLCEMGLLEHEDDGYVPASPARGAILDSYRRETWGLLAQEARERFRSVNDLAIHLQHPGSVWTAQGLERPDYLEKMRESPERARRFTRMLYEIHQPLADELAATLDLDGVQRMMDLGGGSGVASLALLRKKQDLTALVVDLPNVCAAGQEIAEENDVADRLVFHAADMLQDGLPTGFDLVLECDVGVYVETLFEKVRSVLNPGGRFAIVDHLTLTEAIEPHSQLSYVFQGALSDPGFTPTTLADLQGLLEISQFAVTSVQRLSNGMDLVIAAGR